MQYIRRIILFYFALRLVLYGGALEFVRNNSCYPVTVKESEAVIITDLSLRMEGHEKYQEGILTIQLNNAIARINGNPNVLVEDDLTCFDYLEECHNQLKLYGSFLDLNISLRDLVYIPNTYVNSKQGLNLAIQLELFVFDNRNELRSSVRTEIPVHVIPSNNIASIIYNSSRLELRASIQSAFLEVYQAEKVSLQRFAIFDIDRALQETYSTPMLLVLVTNVKFGIFESKFASLASVYEESKSVSEWDHADWTLAYLRQKMCDGLCLEPHCNVYAHYLFGSVFDLNDTLRYTQFIPQEQFVGDASICMIVQDSGISSQVDDIFNHVFFKVRVKDGGIVPFIVAEDSYFVDMFSQATSILVHLEAIYIIPSTRNFSLTIESTFGTISFAIENYRGLFCAVGDSNKISVKGNINDLNTLLSSLHISYSIKDSYFKDSLFEKSDFFSMEHKIFFLVENTDKNFNNNTKWTSNIVLVPSKKIIRPTLRQFPGLHENQYCVHHSEIRPEYTFHPGNAIFRANCHQILNISTVTLLQGSVYRWDKFQVYSIDQIPPLIHDFELKIEALPHAGYFFDSNAQGISSITWNLSFMGDLQWLNYRMKDISFRVNPEYTGVVKISFSIQSKYHLDLKFEQMLWYQSTRQHPYVGIGFRWKSVLLGKLYNIDVSLHGQYNNMHKSHYQLGISVKNGYLIEVNSDLKETEDILLYRGLCSDSSFFKLCCIKASFQDINRFLASLRYMQNITSAAGILRICLDGSDSCCKSPAREPWEFLSKDSQTVSHTRYIVKETLYFYPVVNIL